MTRRFAAGVATGILIAGLVGVGVAVVRTPTSSAAGPSNKSGGAHNNTSVGTRQTANWQQGRAGVVRIRSIQGGPGGEFGFGGVVMRKGGEFTVTAINGNTITATSNGFGPLQVSVDSSGPGPSDGSGAASGTVVVGGPGLGSDSPVSVTNCQIITATAKGPGFGFQDGGPGPVFKQVFPMGGEAPVTVTITVNATTVYTRADQAASLSDVHVGSLLDVQGTPTGAGTITASAIQIVLPQIPGVVTAVNGNNLTMTGLDARTYNVVVGDTTAYHRAGQPDALSDVAVGSLIAAEGDLNNGSTLNALAVTIQLPSVKGQVSAVSGNTVTVNSPDGTTSTVLLTDATTYTAGPQATADKSGVTVGSFIMAEGTLGSDGTLTALRVDIATGVDAGGGPGIKFAPPPGAGPICVPGGDATTSTGPTS
jgi:hypothetical protein